MDGERVVRKRHIQFYVHQRIVTNRTFVCLKKKEKKGKRRNVKRRVKLSNELNIFYSRGRKTERMKGKEPKVKKEGKELE